MVPGPRKGGGRASLGRTQGPAAGRAKKNGRELLRDGGVRGQADVPVGDDEDGTLLGTLQRDVVFHPVAK